MTTKTSGSRIISALLVYWINFTGQVKSKLDSYDMSAAGLLLLGLEKSKKSLDTGLRMLNYSLS